MGRQGRSHAVREKVRQRKEKEKELHKELRVDFLCNTCKKDTEIIEIDYESICNECGTVIENHAFESSGKETVVSIKELFSKPYKRVSHLQERIAQLCATDPEVDGEIVQRIDKYCLEKGKDLEDVFKKDMSNILKALGIDRKISSHYIQILKRLGVLRNLTPMPHNMRVRIKERFIIVEYIIYKYKNLILRRRKNIPNLNYLIFQLIRLESEEYARIYAPHLPQLIAKNQPNDINYKWSIVIEKIKSLNQVFFLEKFNIDLSNYEWKYRPLTAALWLYCNRY